MGVKDAERNLLLTTIRKYCISCCGGYRNDVSKCHVSDCELHPFRNGNIPPELTPRKQVPKRKP